jgi:hypothetical protein
MAQATCPGCGAPIEFKIGSASSVVCANCKTVATRTDRGIENMGQVADVVFSDVALAVYDRGNFRGRAFEISGRVLYHHPAGGSWEEYAAHFSDGQVGTITEAQGRWAVTIRADAHPPPYQALHVGQTVHLPNIGDYVLAEKNIGTFAGGEGELPFSATAGSERSFADLSAAGGAVASIDYGDGTSAPLVNVGTACEYEELNIERRGIDRGEKIKTGATICPSCGAPVPICAPNITERIACRFCGAISDLGKNTVLSQQSRRDPWIPLGSMGTLSGVLWIVIGYMERSADIQGENYFWNEYLLYEATHGYRWLVFDEGSFAFCESVAVGDVELSGYPHVVRARGRAFKARNANPARVEYVLGEFYWKVTVGETVHAEDFEAGKTVLSSEQANGEINWTLATPMSVSNVQKAFNLDDRNRPGAALHMGVSENRSDDESPSNLGAALPSLKTAVIVIFAILFIWVIQNGTPDDDDDGGLRSTGSVGGFGGK